MIASFSIVPLSAGEELKEALAGVMDIIDRSGVDYRAGAMQTTVEGEFEEVMALIKECHLHMKSRFPRVLTSITIDDREGARDRMEGKVRDVEAVLGRGLKR